MTDPKDKTNTSASASTDKAAIPTTHHDFKISNGTNVAKYDGTQTAYGRWATGVRDVARENGIKCLFIGSTRPPYRSQEIWDEIEDKMIGWLFNTLKEEVRDSMREIEDTLDTIVKFMDYMETTYSPSKSVNKYNTFLELCQVTQGSKTVTEVGNEFKRIKGILNAQKVKLDDLYALMLLNVFGPQYNITKQMITSSDEIPNIDSILSKMMSRETEINMEKNKEAGEALSSSRNSKPPVNDNRADNNNGKSYREPDRSKTCSNPNCKMSGHLIEDCMMPGGGREDQERKPKWMLRKIE